MVKCWLSATADPSLLVVNPRDVSRVPGVFFYATRRKYNRQSPLRFGSAAITANTAKLTGHAQARTLRVESLALCFDGTSSVTASARASATG